ncbi:MAG: hypothetical protein CML46_13385 [Rhodobacteraceae bacterium]|nr:hypothetical protein [Paracoccaceae bacterium]MBR27922.1 hypothetical protein [Paracoccaceae bacterium]
MARGESDRHGAQAQAGAAGTDLPPASDAARAAAGRYLDAWEFNQSEVSRLGPSALPSILGGFPSP